MPQNAPPQNAPLTIGQVAAIYDIPIWRMRRIVDGLGVEIPRLGQNRLISRDLLGAIGAAIDGSKAPKGENLETAGV